MKKLNKTEDLLSHFYGIGLVLAFLLPHTATPFLLVNPLLCVFFRYWKNTERRYKYNALVFVPFLFTAIINMAQEIEPKSLLTAATILLYVICFPIVGRLKPKNIYFYVIFSFIFLSQITYILDIPGLTSFFDTYYPIVEKHENAFNYMVDNITAETIMDYRLGGLYRNSNDCSRALTMILVSYLIWNNNNEIKKILPFISIIYYSVFLTGSRTGFIIASISLFLFFVRIKKVSYLWRFLFIVVAILSFFFMVFISDESFRSLNIEGGINDSFSLKVDTFLYYLSSEDSLFKILFGYLDPTRFHSSSLFLHKFDSDYGNLVFCYGIVGFVCILIYFYTIFKRMTITGKLFFVLLLWMLTSTIVMAFRAFFLFMLLLSPIFANEEHGKQNAYK